ncbi:hypothetical protein SAMN05444746_13713 [Variovorax sp. OK212]|nr:hypothetical protein SAMN05518853_13913 [Variovorax sp. OK202]SFE76039.1 hypothetical protein SAMN05444746_13713 [Variovorax sp. OK212]
MPHLLALFKARRGIPTHCLSTVGLQPATQRCLASRPDDAERLASLPHSARYQTCQESEDGRPNDRRRWSPKWASDQRRKNQKPLVARNLLMDPCFSSSRAVVGQTHDVRRALASLVSSEGPPRPWERIRFNPCASCKNGEKLKSKRVPWRKQWGKKLWCTFVEMARRRRKKNALRCTRCVRWPTGGLLRRCVKSRKRTACAGANQTPISRSRPEGNDATRQPRNPPAPCEKAASPLLALVDGSAYFPKLEPYRPNPLSTRGSICLKPTRPSPFSLHRNQTERRCRLWRSAWACWCMVLRSRINRSLSPRASSTWSSRAASAAGSQHEAAPSRAHGGQRSRPR